MAERVGLLFPAGDRSCLDGGAEGEICAFFSGGHWVRFFSRPNGSVCVCSNDFTWVRRANLLRPRHRLRSHKPSAASQIGFVAQRGCRWVRIFKFANDRCLEALERGLASFLQAVGVQAIGFVAQNGYTRHSRSAKNPFSSPFATDRARSARLGAAPFRYFKLNISRSSLSPLARPWVRIFKLPYRLRSRLPTPDAWNWV